MNKIFYTYHDLLLDVSVIHDQYMSTFTAPPDLVVGLTRGGLVPAVHLSHTFRAPMIALQWSTRDYVEKNAQQLSELLNLAETGVRILVVDDIFDSGVTLNSLAEAFQANHLSGRLPVYAALITNQNSDLHASFVAEEVLLTGSYIKKTENDWIVFPWENNA